MPLLVKYLRDVIAVIEKEHPNLLAEEHFEMLADLIAPPARKRGRPKGRDPSEQGALMAFVDAGAFAPGL